MNARYTNVTPDPIRAEWRVWPDQENPTGWRSKLDLVLRKEHEAGEKMFVDWAGATIPVWDRHTGVAWQSALFVAALGASSYTWAEANGGVNQAREFSGAGEKSGGKWRNGTHQDDPPSSLRLDAENGTVRKYLALLGIIREEGMDARRALALTTGD